MTSLARIQLEASLKTITFTIPVEPRGWARARRHGNVYFIDPATQFYRNAIVAFASEAMVRHTLIEGPVEMTVISIITPPESWSTIKRKRAVAGEIMPACKPDADNLFKAVADALNKVVYRDDAQIIDARSVKRYGARPEVQIAVSEIEPARLAPVGSTVSERSIAGG